MNFFKCCNVPPTSTTIKINFKKREKKNQNTYVSHPTPACPRNLTGGDKRCWKRKQTENQICIKLGPGRLGAQMETHQPPPPPGSLSYTVTTQGGEAILGGEGVTL
jgi:hypothetical protein